MSSRVAILITNYNMPERTNALCEHIRSHVRCPYDLFVIDNGSDIAPVSLFTTRRLEANIQTTGGWLEALKCADVSEHIYSEKYFAYWFLITSAEFVPESGDVLSPMLDFLMDTPEAVGIHPALTEDSTTAWKHLIARGGIGFRPTWMIDNIASLYRADWFNEQGRFDPALRYGWGIDLETCYKARSCARSLWVCEDVRMKKVTDIGYTMQRMNMTAEERRRLAGESMDVILGSRYGHNWREKMDNEYVQENLR